MEYLYYKSERGNFGDDLNAWLWPLFFGPEQKDENKVLLGIGSVLSNGTAILKGTEHKQKVVFGTGIRASYAPFAFDDTYDVRFLRGPLSAQSSHNKFEFIADAAYAMRLLENFKSLATQEKKYKISVMPYFKSVDYFDWKKICADLGMHYISPYAENGVEQTIREIAASEYLITEAMHGAIIADILRVPWSRFVLSTPHTEGAMVSEFKWMDWLHSLQMGAINTAFIKFYRGASLNRKIKKLSRDYINAEFLARKMTSTDIAKTLAGIKDYYLSEDPVIRTIDDRISGKIQQLQKETGMPVAVERTI